MVSVVLFGVRGFYYTIPYHTAPYRTWRRDDFCGFSSSSSSAPTILTSLLPPHPMATYGTARDMMRDGLRCLYLASSPPPQHTGCMVHLMINTLEADSKPASTLPRSFGSSARARAVSVAIGAPDSARRVACWWVGDNKPLS